MLEVAVSKCNVDSVSEVLQDRPLRLSFIPGSLLVSKAYYYLDYVFCN